MLATSPVAVRSDRSRTMSEAEIRKPVKDKAKPPPAVCQHCWMVARTRTVQKCTKCGDLRMKPTKGKR